MHFLWSSVFFSIYFICGFSTICVYFSAGVSFTVDVFSTILASPPSTFATCHLGFLHFLCFASLFPRHPFSIILLYLHRLCFRYHLFLNYIGFQSHLPGFSADTPLRFLYVLRFNLSLRFLHYLCFMLIAFVLASGAFNVTF